MAKIRRVIRCHQCGAILQDKDPKMVGYIDKKAMADHLKVNPEAILYCNSCYTKIKEMNNSTLKDNVDEDVLKILDDAVASDGVIIYVVDLFSFNGTFKEKIIKKIKNLDVFVVATKRDYFSSTIKNEVFEQFILERFKEVKITPKAIHIVSTGDASTYKQLVDRITVSRKGHDVYLMGDVLSGKTTLINNCLKHYTNKSKREIRTITYPGTASKVLEVPFDNSSFLYELPSLPIDNSVAGKLEKDVQKLVVPKRGIQTPSWTLLKGEAILIGSLANFSLISGKPTKVKLYVADEVEFKKLQYTKLRETMIANRQKRLIRPVSDRLQSFRDYDVFEYEMENDGLMHDISIEGLGWISFVAKGQTFRIMLPKGAALKESLSKVR
jgi:ribosome biogenesis GTPase A